MDDPLGLKPLINKPPPSNWSYNWDPNIKALGTRGLFIMGLHQGLGRRAWVFSDFSGSGRKVWDSDVGCHCYLCLPATINEKLAPLLLLEGAASCCSLNSTPECLRFQL